MHPTSIVMVTRSQLEFTRLCLTSIFDCTPEAYELIAVDNASSDGTVEYFRSEKVIGSVIGYR